MCSEDNDLKLVRIDRTYPAGDIVWTNAHRTQDRIYAKTNAEFFKKGECKVKVEIPDQNPVEITLKLMQEEKVHRESSIATYEYDPNNNKKYKECNGENCIGVKFLELSKSDDIEISSKPEDEDSYRHVVLESSDDEVVEVSAIGLGEYNRILHDIMSKSVTGFDFESLPTVKMCDRDIYKVMAAPRQKVDLHIYELIESDDDVPNYCHDEDEDGISYESGTNASGNPDYDIDLLPDCKTPISSTEHHCIDAGPDGTVDLHKDLMKYMKGDDEEIEIDRNGTIKYEHNMITAGPNKKCDTRPYRSGSRGTFDFREVDHGEGHDRGQTDVLSRIAEIDAFYHRIGVDVVPHWKGTLYWNYDTTKDDDKMDHDLDPWVVKEFKQFFNELLGEGKKPKEPHLFLINEFESASIRGLAVNGLI